jgi:lipoprotein-releasing system permease protein
LRSKKADAALSVVTVLAILGVLLAVSSMNIVTAVMTGFSDDLRDKILGANAHVVVFRYGGGLVDHEETTERVAAVEGVAGASPFIFSELMIRSSWSHTGVIVKGIDPSRVGDVTHVQDDLVQGPTGPLTTDAERVELIARMTGEFPAYGLDGEILETDLEKPLPGIIIGTELAEQLQVKPSDKVQLINPVGGGVGPMGLPTPSVRPVRVAAIFESGMYEYDTKWTYITIPDAQAFLKLGEVVNGIEARVTDIDGVDPISIAVEDALGYPFHVRHWKNLNRNLFSALKLEKIVMGIILSLITVVAGMNIVGTLILMVLTRNREISILRAMGASAGQIRLVFMLEGLIVGVVGTILGTVLGLLGCLGLRNYEFPLDTDVYYLDTLPVVIEPPTIMVVVVVAVAISFLCTLYPTTVAARLDPVEGLRYE